MNENPCIVCGKPRDGGRIWCGADACLQAVLAMPTEELSAIREREALEALRRSPLPADGRGVYIHITPKEEEETLSEPYPRPVYADDGTLQGTWIAPGRYIRNFEDGHPSCHDYE